MTSITAEAITAAASTKVADLRGKNVLITGGNRGIGFEISQAFARSGANVAIVYASSEEAPKRASEIASEFNVRCEAFKSPVDQISSLCETISTIDAGWNIDILVTNAGIVQGMDSMSLTEERFDLLNAVNYKSVYFAIQHMGEIWLKSNRKGNIVIVSSISSLIVNRPQSQVAYNASKAAVTMVGKGFAAEWASKNIRVNMISPGYIKTDLISSDGSAEQKAKYDALYKLWSDMTPMKRFGTPAEVGGIAVFLASDAASYMTGSEIVVDGGYTLW